jgi:glycosyltransferase involved in cell wall biosynthesis
MFVVASLSNANGMASWCWEAAHSLQELGQPVVLVCAEDIKLPGEPKVQIIRFTPEWDVPKLPKTLIERFLNEAKNLSIQPIDYLAPLHKLLISQGIVPSAYFLNMCTLHDPSISVPQHIVGWAYPTSLQGYIEKIGRAYQWRFSKALIRGSFEYLGWWRKDWNSYRNVDSVLAVSERLRLDLSKKGIKTFLSHPGTAIRSNPPEPHNLEKCKLLIAAYDLEEDRKRIPWMVQALAVAQKKGQLKHYSLTLVGRASDQFKKWVASTDIPHEFLGHISREALQGVMSEHDVFLFGSRFDDWGYVLVEAMGQGLCVIAPDISPFDEIIGRSGLVYQMNSSEDFSHQVASIAPQDLFQLRYSAWERATTLFSRKAFGQSLVDAHHAIQGFHRSGGQS